MCHGPAAVQPFLHWALGAADRAAAVVAIACHYNERCRHHRTALHQLSKLVARGCIVQGFSRPANPGQSVPVRVCGYVIEPWRREVLEWQAGPR
jgi:hypothetical protein